jgi:hypothetical protein
MSEPGLPPGRAEAPATSASDLEASRGIAPRHLLGVLLIALTALPVYRLLSAETGLAGEATAAMTGGTMAVAWSGLLALAGFGLLAARLLPYEAVADFGGRIRETLLWPPALLFAGLLAGLAFALAVAFNLLVLEGQPNLIDSMSSLLHARYLAAGQIAGHGAEAGAFFHMQQSLYAEQGWASQYPPGSIVLLAAGFRLGAVGIVGPAMLGVAVFFTALAAERLLPERPATARLGALFAAVSAFAIAQAGAYTSHAPAAAFGAMAIYGLARLRATETHGWAVFTGAAPGALFATRPLTAVAIGAVVALALIRSPLRLAAIVAGFVPFAVAVFAWNDALFGAPLTWGYTAALGPGAGPGFGLDPWGNQYGPVEAIAYTSAELIALGVHLLGTPLPLVAAIGLWLLLAGPLAAGERIVLAWALAPVAANFFYWHHGLFMGPRMLADAAPAWCLLTAMAMTGLVTRAPVSFQKTEWSPRAFAATVFSAAVLAGLVWVAPGQLASHVLPPSLAMAATRRAETPALVFVHGGWGSRIAMRLAAAGMRLDSVETALRQNSTCAVHQAFPDGRGASASGLDFAPRATDLPPVVEVSPGNRIRMFPGEVMTPACRREILSDARGTIEVATLYWLSDLPGVDQDGVMFVRDLGPDENIAFIARYPERHVYALLTPAPDAAPELVPYEEGMALLWSDSRNAPSGRE